MADESSQALLGGGEERDFSRQSGGSRNRTLYSRSPSLQAAYASTHDAYIVVPTGGDGSVSGRYRRVSTPATGAPPSVGTPVAVSPAPSSAGDVVVVVEGQPGARPPPSKGVQAAISFAYNLSWAVNILLLVTKGYAFYISNSKAVLASLIDSVVDIISQAVVFVAEWRAGRIDPNFPVGQTRLEALGVLACACIMSVSAFEVIQVSISTLYDGFAKAILPELDAGVMMYAILGTATGLKLVCYIYCVALQKQSDSMWALAEDHLNDIMSNVGAIATAGLASVQGGRFWWSDGAGAILISAYIVYRWVEIAKNQIEKLVGRAAPPDFLKQLEELASSHHGDLTVDCIRAYHFGARFMVEMEVVMPPDSVLRVVHDTAMVLQHRLEALPEVERAFVHVDYQKREEPEHRTERLLHGLAPVLEEPTVNGAEVALSR